MQRCGGNLTVESKEQQTKRKTKKRVDGSLADGSQEESFSSPLARFFEGGEG